MKRSPQLENGYIRYAHELDAALAYADFTKGARIVLREVFSQIFGPAALKTAKVSPSALAKRYESDKGTFGRSIRELTDANVLIKIGECEYRFNKDYGQWAKNGKSRLSKIEMDLAVTATEIAMSYKQVSVGNPANDHGSEQQVSVGNPANGTLAVQPTDGLAIQPTSRQSSQRNVGSSANDSHYIEPAHGIEKGEKEEGEKGSAPRDFVPPQNDPKEVARIAALAEERWPAENADYFVGDLCRTLSVTIVREVLDRAFDKWPRLRLDTAKRKWIRTACDGLVTDGWTPRQQKPHRSSRFDPPTPKIFRKGDKLS